MNKMNRNKKMNIEKISSSICISSCVLELQYTICYFCGHEIEITIRTFVFLLFFCLLEYNILFATPFIINTLYLFTCLLADTSQTVTYP